MIEKLDRSSGNVIGYHFSSVIDKSDYEVLVPEMESLVKEHGTVRMLCDLTDFKWEKFSAWPSDARFGHEFKNKITRMAIIGDGVGQKIIAVFADKFYCPDSARYFEDEDAAWAWLSE
ncbi:MAG: STAS/SEC14 domain-containing protein [Candidatus Nanopelagicales bacterium]|nr:STAS/SEC14 domain-containing protein [Candidatus Nanopelagicales bacterium]MDZ4250531.1 STAS/SEC14 domain-containing protein [Candidatus Nanopelagicales bacterium]